MSKTHLVGNAALQQAPKKISTESSSSTSKYAPIVDLLPLSLFLCIAFFLRLWLINHTQAFIDGDEAIVGIQAQHILKGEWPVYYYGQSYMGSLEAYLIALLFLLFGANSTFAIRLEPALLSLVLIWLSWKLAGALADQAQLSARFKKWFMNIVAFCAVLPPLYDMVIQLRAWGGHIEIYLVMMALLYCSLRLTQDWQRDVSALKLTLWWACIGFLVGLGMWIYPLVITVVGTIALWIGIFVLLKIARIKRLYLIVAALPMALLGFTPALVWGATHNWANITYMFASNVPPDVLAKYPSRFEMLKDTVKLYATCVAPHVVGGTLSDTTLSYTMLFAAFGICCVVVATFLTLWSFKSTQIPLVMMRQLVGLPLLFIGCVTIIFCASSISAGGLLFPCQRDEVGRYAAPIHLALPFVFAALALVIALLIDTRRSGAQQHSALEAYTTFSKPALFALLTFLVIATGIRLPPYVKANPATTFQSFACHIQPIQNKAITEYMKQHNIQYAWGSMWIGNAITFETQEKIIVSDPRIVTVNARNRLPENTTAVQQAEKASILAFVHHDEKEPKLLKELDKLQVEYRVARFPTQTADWADVLVITPFNKTLAPGDANSLGSWAFGC